MVEINNLHKDIQLGVQLSSPLQITESGLKREYYIVISLIKIQITIGYFDNRRSKSGNKKRRRLRC